MRQVRLVAVALVVCLAIPVLARAQMEITAIHSATAAASGAPLFLPHNWARGFTQFEAAPSHNEPDLGRCGPASRSDGANAPCAAFARYMLSAYLEIQPFGRTPLRHLFFFYEPRMSFGHNVPQMSYTTSFSAIAYERGFGAGIELPKHFELRIVQHQVDWLGRYRNNLGASDLETTGPYGLYSTIGVRWYFGGYGGSHGGSGF